MIIWSSLFINWNKGQPKHWTLTAWNKNKKRDHFYSTIHILPDIRKEERDYERGKRCRHFGPEEGWSHFQGAQNRESTEWSNHWLVKYCHWVLFFILLICLTLKKNMLSHHGGELPLRLNPGGLRISPDLVCHYADLTSDTLRKKVVLSQLVTCLLKRWPYAEYTAQKFVITQPGSSPLTRWSHGRYNGQNVIITQTVLSANTLISRRMHCTKGRH